eukprot:TRINITY_DN6876_c0_g1_i1.p1 TRINITY_DN6876_c0_g1~~TRINITY_DN6876_c0_g1_i1.p1  ORF type:complete len:310 (-),score=58.78 TRINITY_DN6876_c0_g1_i1:168-1097(-)
MKQIIVIVCILMIATVCNSCTIKSLPHPIYYKICDQLEDMFSNNPGTAPFILRLAWHSSGTFDHTIHDHYGYGSKGGTLRFKKEQAHPNNAGINLAVELMDKIHKQYPWLSHGDLYTLGGSVAVTWGGGPQITWLDGRCDAPNDTYVPPQGNLPDAIKPDDVAPTWNKTMDAVKDVFARMGFNYRETVALIGAHAMGKCHADRSGFDGPWTPSPESFSNQFFVILKLGDWKLGTAPNDEPQYNWSGMMMLPSDFGLMTDPDLSPFVDEYADDEDIFFKDFTAAFEKLLNNGVANRCYWSPCACTIVPHY